MYQCIYIEQITIRGPSYSAETNKECHYSSFFLIDQPIYKPIPSMIFNKLHYNSEQGSARLSGKILISKLLINFSFD